jgi:hypothetical protein
MISEIKHTTRWDALKRPVQAAIMGNVIVIVFGFYMWLSSERFGNYPWLKASGVIILFVFCNGLILVLERHSDKDIPDSLGFRVPLQEGRGGAHYLSIIKEIEAFLSGRRIDHRWDPGQKAGARSITDDVVCALIGQDARLVVKMDLEIKDRNTYEPAIYALVLLGKVSNPPAPGHLRLMEELRSHLAPLDIPWNGPSPDVETVEMT